MKFSVIKVDIDGKILEDFGILTLKELTRLAVKSFIPEVFENGDQVMAAMSVIERTGSDEWYAAGPAIIKIKRVEE